MPDQTRPRATRTITVPHLARVEGYGALEVELDGDKIKKVELRILEGARFYEGLVRGQRYAEVPGIVSRICAICSASHTLCSTAAVEDALGVKVTPRTRELRDLLHQGENIESHALHVFMLALPDYLGFASAIDMAREYPNEVNLALALKKLGNRVQETIGGRAIHPVNVLLGRFGKLPDREALKGLLGEIESALGQIPPVVELFAKIPQPTVPAEPTVYLALRPENGYGFTSRNAVARLPEGVKESKDPVIPADQFANAVGEKVVAHSHAKHSLLDGKPFLVGAQARVAVNRDRLDECDLAGGAMAALEKAFGRFDSGNPFLNNLAQLVELAWSLSRAREILLARLAEKPGVVEDPPRVEPREGTGFAMIEAPRGILYHRYSFDREGRVTSADVITPTALNLANLERDLRAGAEKVAASDKTNTGQNLQLEALGPFKGKDLKLFLEALIRTYDPCISCSVH